MTVRGGRAQQTHGQWRATMRTSERRRFSPVLRGVTDYGTILSPRSAGSCFFFTRNFPCARGVRTLCPLSISRCAARGAHARAGGRPSWRRLGPRRDEPQLSFRLSREMASLVVVSGIAGVEVLVKPCVGHAWKADAVSGEDETGARARAREFQRTHAPAATQHTTSTACRQRRSKSGP